MIKKKLKKLASLIEDDPASKFMHRLMWVLLFLDVICLIFKDGYSGSVPSMTVSVVVFQFYIGGVICAKLEKMKG